jgi:CMP-N-acetylneuraminic acid synthetase
MIFNRKVIALVPIKEHSERVKSKNFRDFNGKPLYHHIMETLQKTYAVDEIIVNTDSSIVANEASNLWSKVKIINRPDELIGDFVSVNKLIKHDINNSDGDIYLQTHATNPLLKAETIAQAIKKFAEVEENYDSLFTVNRFQTRFYTHDGKPINHNPEELLRTQDLNPVFEENSCIYMFTKESFDKNERRIANKPFIFETPHIESIDIDDEFSFKLAEILSIYHSKN